MLNEFMLDKKELTRVAELAKLDISKDPDAYVSELNSMIIEEIAPEKLSSFVVEAYPLDLSLVNTFREDEITPSLTRMEVLANAPKAEAGCISVPKIGGVKNA